MRYLSSERGEQQAKLALGIGMIVFPCLGAAAFLGGWHGFFLALGLCVATIMVISGIIVILQALD
jgi:hypothetical protein